MLKMLILTSIFVCRQLSSSNVTNDEFKLSVQKYFVGSTLMLDQKVSLTTNFLTIKLIIRIYQIYLSFKVLITFTL